MHAKQRLATSNNDFILFRFAVESLICLSLNATYSSHRISRFSLVVYAFTADSKDSSAPVENMAESGTAPVSSCNKLQGKGTIVSAKFQNDGKVSTVAMQA